MMPIIIAVASAGGMSVKLVRVVSTAGTVRATRPLAVRYGAGQRLECVAAGSSYLSNTHIDGPGDGTPNTWVSPGF